MPLNKIKLYNFRNFTSLDVDLTPGFNIFYGENGSGKTSLLEAVHYLNIGRSFRTHLTRRIIQHGQESMTLFGEIEAEVNQVTSVGIQRNKLGEGKIKISGKAAQSVVELIKLQPLLVINPNTYQLLDAGPKFRRQFIDWGLFHVEQSYSKLWRQCQRTLKQRNAALRQQAPKEQVQIWDKDFVTQVEEVTGFRLSYIDQLKPIFFTLCESLLGLTELELSFYSGWRQETNFQLILQESWQRDSYVGSTQVGPHRADIKLKVGGIPVEHVLSRGQQKLLICALRLAQGVLLKENADKNCLYLIDDLPSELDQHSLSKILTSLAEIDAQVIITAILPNSLSILHELDATKVFHVKHNGTVAR